MRFLKVAAATLVLLPALLTALPAEALTAKQYQHQGRGQYLNSTGSRAGYAGYRGYRHRYTRHHRHGR